MFRIFQKLSIPNHKSWGARTHVMCHVSCIRCQMSDVRCPMSCVRCQMSHVTCQHFFGQSGGASQWSVCFQLGLTPSSFETYTICHNRPSSPRVRKVITSHCPLAQCTVHSTQCTVHSAQYCEGLYSV